MASSSVSQESLDMDEFETTARRNRIRVHRGYGARGLHPYRPMQDRDESPEKDDKDGEHPNGDAEVGGSNNLGLSAHTHLPVDHESPTRGAAARLKDKRSRANHMKGKLPKDKRKLREKRRSTGVVHCMPSTESTGDSLDEDDDDEDVTHDTKRNTTFNESASTGHHHQTLYETRHSSAPSYVHKRRNKSPSDLEADLEDNQDYDSTVSHSETNLTLIGRPETSDPLPSSLGGHTRPTTGGKPTPTHLGGSSGFRGNVSTRYSPETSRTGFRSASSTYSSNTNAFSSDADSSRTNTPSTSSSSSILSRYREMDSPHHPASSSTSNTNLLHSAGQFDSDSPRARLLNQSAAAPGAIPNTTTSIGSAAGDKSTSSSLSGGGSVASNSSSSQIQPRPVGFSVFRDGNPPSSAHHSTSARGDNRSLFSNSVGGGSRFSRDRDAGAGVGSVHSRLASYQSPRPFVSSPTNTTGAASQQPSSESMAHLEKQLEKEKEENQKLQQQLDEKDKKIAELEKAIELLNNECDGLDEDNLKLQEENKALIRAMSKLTTNV